MSSTTTAEHWYVVDTFHAGVLIPKSAPVGRDDGFANRPKCQAASRTAELMPPRLGSAGTIAEALDRMHREGKELRVETEIPNGRKLHYRAFCARYTPVSEAAAKARYQADATAELHVWLDGGVRTILNVTLRWKKFGTECWLNLRANPTTLLIGTNVFAADTGLDPDRERLCLYRHPFLLFERLLRAVDPAFRWSDATAGRIERGDLELKNVQLAYYLPFKGRAGLRRFLHWLRAVFCTPIVTKTWSSFELGKYLRLRVERNWTRAGARPG